MGFPQMPCLQELRLAENLFKHLEAQKAALQVDIRAEDWAAPLSTLPPAAGAHSPTASYQATDLQPPPVHKSRNQLQGWQRQGCPRAGTWHRLQQPQSTWHSTGGSRLGADVPLAHGEEAGEPLESHGMKSAGKPGPLLCSSGFMGYLYCLGCPPWGSSTPGVQNFAKPAILSAIQLPKPPAKSWTLLVAKMLQGGL